MKTITHRILHSSRQSIPKAIKTVGWLLKIILPVSLAVSLLQHFGIISYVASFLAPAFSLLGLPGESAVVFISSIFLPLYAPIAIMTTLSLNLREMTILALMCLISHNLVVETAIQKKTGSSAVAMFLTRIGASVLGAIVLNALLPATHAVAEVTLAGHVANTGMADILIEWFKGASVLALKITLIVTALMMLQDVLKEFNVLTHISGIFAPTMRTMGLSDSSSFLWFVAQTIGLTYGSAVMLEEVERNGISPSDANLLNYHIAINHSLLEDTLLFVAIGVSAPWIIIPRFVFAIGMVWGVKAVHKVKTARTLHTARVRVEK